MSVRLASLVKEFQRIPPASVSEATEIFIHPDTWRVLVSSAESLSVFAIELNAGDVTFCGKLIKEDASVLPGKIELR